MEKAVKRYPFCGGREVGGAQGCGAESSEMEGDCPSLHLQCIVGRRGCECRRACSGCEMGVSAAKAGRVRSLGWGGAHIGHLFLIRAVILGGEGRGAASPRHAVVRADAAQNTPETADALNCFEERHCAPAGLQNK